MYTGHGWRVAPDCHCAQVSRHKQRNDDEDTYGEPRLAARAFGAAGLR
jgi:hypothetical protein